MQKNLTRNASLLKFFKTLFQFRDLLFERFIFLL